MSVRLLLVGLAVVAVGCSTNPGPTAVEVTVVLEPGLLSRCVRVSATDGDGSIESEPLVIGSKTTLKVGIVPVAGLTSPITVRAFGFRRADCTEPLAGEVSEPATASFTKAVDRVTLTLRPEVMDGGVDLDGDGWSPPEDCNDFDPALHPGQPESCVNSIDDDCDGLVDCRDEGCFGLACAGGGTCVADAGCLQAMEVTCDDGVDNDGDTLTDCLDVATCLGQACSDGNSCTSGDLCQPNGTCLKTSDVVCNMPPSPTVCFAAAGTCQADGGMCSYAPTTNACDDGDPCTMSSACSNGQCVGSNRLMCNSPPMCRLAGSCNSGTGACDYPASPNTTACNDGQNCTTNDRCDGSGGCAGTPVTCTPGQCQLNNGCNTQGVCQFTANTNAPCDAGVGVMGQCNASANCVAPSLFPYTTSNFVEGDVPSTSAALTMNCQVTLDTTAATVSSNSCGVTMPPSRVFTPPGATAQPTLIVHLTSMTLNSGAELILTGGRPVIFAVTGAVTINAGARLRVTNGSTPPTGCGSGGNNTGNGTGSGTAGGGGGGFGSNGGAGGDSGGGGAGAAGQANTDTTLLPLRGGCPGGNGTSTGGAGGGAVQISASTSLTLNGAINAGGQGGRGATASGGNSGGGGGSGGAILLEAATLTLNSGAVLAANGGGGGEGSKGQVGGAGTDGQESTMVSPGGTGNNGDDGGDGAAVGGTATAGASASNNDGAGGGGGGRGRIRLNAFGSCTRNATTVSPTPTRNAGCP